MLQKLRSMGTLKDIMGMIPGMGAQLQGMDLDEKQFYSSEAIIHSMTPKERMDPLVLNVSRRQRIARGSGTSVDQVNLLLKNFKQMKKQLQQMRKMGILGNMLDPTRKMRKGKERDLERMRRMGVNPMDVAQVRAFKKHVQAQDRKKARKQKRKKKRR